MGFRKENRKLIDNIYGTFKNINMVLESKDELVMRSYPRQNTQNNNMYLDYLKIV